MMKVIHSHTHAKSVGNVTVKSINGLAVTGAGDGTILLVLGLKERHQLDPFVSVIIASTEFSLAGSIVVVLCFYAC